jgi:hypothetical protein
MSYYDTLARRMLREEATVRPSAHPTHYGQLLDFAACVLRDLDTIPQTTELDKR